jgi:WhiB family redox-sensing transcriptional regulator
VSGAFGDQFTDAFTHGLPNFPQANCKDAEIPPDSWFPEESAPRTLLVRARELCSTCPVMVECRDWATEMFIDFGLWGNTTPRQRRRLRKDRENGTTHSMDVAENFA